MRLYLFLTPLLAIFSAVFSFANAQSQPNVNCPEIEVTTEITHTSQGKDNGAILLKFPETVKASEYHIFLNCVGCTDPKKAIESTFKALKQGFYDIYVIDKKGCSKQLIIQVK